VNLSLYGKNVQIGGISNFTNTLATILFYKKLTDKNGSIIWKLSKKNILKQIDRKKI
jgi:hypothetical protein